MKGLEVFASIVIFAFLFALISRACNDRRDTDCEKRGGVWLYREGKCLDRSLFK